jgi:chemotaxis protein CheX
MAMDEAFVDVTENTDEQAPDELDMQLPAILDLKAAAPLVAAFLDRRGADIVVDAAGVQRLGGQCLQVLLSAQSSWAEDAKVMVIQNASPEFCSAIELFGAGSALSFNPKESCS